MHTPQCTYNPSCFTSIRISESFTSLAITRNESLQSLPDSSMHGMYKENFNQVVCYLGSKACSGTPLCLRRIQEVRIGITRVCQDLL